MSRNNMPIPKDPKQCQPWLYEYLKRLNDTANKAATGIAQVARGEIPGGSGQPLPNPDLSGFFLLAGRPTGQIGRGGTAASETLQLSSTANATKGKIHLGYPTARLTVDEAGRLVGINQTSPATILHINSPAVVTNGSPVAASIGFPNSWSTQSGATTSAAFIAAVTDGLDSTYATEAVINTPGSEMFFTLWVDGTNPLSSGDTFTLTFRHRRTAGQAGTERFKFELARGGFGTIATYTRGVQSSASFEDYAVTLTSTEAANLLGTGDVTIGVFAVGIGAASFDIAEIYYSHTPIPATSLLRWDSLDVQLGQISPAGRLGINTASATPGAEVHVVGTLSSIPTLMLVAATSQSTDIMQIKASTGKILASVDSVGTLVGNTAQVFYEDEIVSWEDDAVYYSPLNP